MRRHISSHPMLSLGFACMGLGLTVELLRCVIGPGGATWDSLTENWVYMAVEVVAVAICAARALRHPQHRRAWALMTVALTCWSVGDLLWAVWLDNVTDPPFPSPADASYLLMYPAMYGALMLLIRSRLRDAGAAQWLDGGVVALAIAACAAALVFSTITSTTQGHVVADVVTIAYPVGDFILLMFIALAYTLAGWRPGKDWLLLGAGVVLMAVGDIVNADQVAGGIYVADALLNAIYLTSFSLLATAAWAPSRAASEPRREAYHTILLTLTAAALALALLVSAAFISIDALAVGLAAASLILTAIRSTLTYVENVRMLRARTRETFTDSLTGLANRRQLMSDLGHAAKDGIGQPSRTLAFFDLNGFKRYNDTFGHLAGDRLLTRLADALTDAVAGCGRIYRLGGDEFCVLLDDRYQSQDPLIAIAAAALTERGQGFDVTTAVGIAIIPDEAGDPSAALRLADERMYADKGRAHRSQTRDVLIQLLLERDPALLDHVSGVAVLARAVAAELRLDAEQVDETLRAAELHDIGKLAIPDAILDKPGPLDEVEWEFIRQHTIIGERVLCAAPALAPVARLVRSSHERWDGRGYPDGLTGEAIPLGSRILAACDAYEAMTTHRCYQAARSRAAALAELRRTAGSQFDPAVVRAIERHFGAAPDAARITLRTQQAPTA